MNNPRWQAGKKDSDKNPMYIAPYTNWGDKPTPYQTIDTIPPRKSGRTSI